MAENLSNDELRKELFELGANPGPITATTRSIWLRKLQRLRDEKQQTKKSNVVGGGTSTTGNPKITHPGDSWKSSNDKISASREPVARPKTNAAKYDPRPKERGFDSDSAESEDGRSKTTSATGARRRPRESFGQVVDKKPEGVIPGQINIPSLSPPKRSESLAFHKPSLDFQKPTLPSVRRGSRMSGGGSFDRFGYSDHSDENEESPPTLVNRSANTSFKMSPPTFGGDLKRRSLTGRPAIGASRMMSSDAFARPAPAPTRTTTSSVSAGLGRFRSDVEQKWRGSFGRPSGQWSSWTKRLPPHTSVFLLAALLLFLMILTFSYVAAVHRTKVVFVLRVCSEAVQDTARFVYANLILPLLILTLICGAGLGAYWLRWMRQNKGREERRQVFHLVNQIIGMLQKHKVVYDAGHETDPCLPVPHIRDVLIPPENRKELRAVWEKAQQYINESESRVRTETQFVAGQESAVWRWLPNNPKSQDKVWQGHAFADAPHQANLNTQLQVYSECLKLRGMFGDPSGEKERDWPEHIQDALLERMGESLPVLHLAVDTASKEGCVYMKLRNRSEAGRAFQLLHGSWFNGRLVTVKYLRSERYNERFPDAARAMYPLEIKKPRHSVDWR